MRVARRASDMNARTRLLWSTCCVFFATATANAQPTTTAGPTGAADAPPPGWDTQVGASFVGTSGNTDTTTLGVDFSMHRRWPAWQIESTATAVRASSGDVGRAERYLGQFRAERKLTTIVGLSAGERAERDRLAGTDFRSVLDLGLTWAVVHSSRWTIDATTAAAWDHESPTSGDGVDHPTGLLEAVSHISLGAASELTQRFAFSPDFEESSAYRSEADIAAQASMNNHLALKLDYLWRYSHTPVAGFKRIDNTTTASLVLRWRSPR
jgi:putative salt-induced outer membrane protein YdiY